MMDFSSFIPGQTTGYNESPLPHVDYVEVVWIEERAFLPPKVSVMARRKAIKADRRWCSRYISKVGSVFQPDLLYRVKGVQEATVTKGGDIGRDGKTSIFVTCEVKGSRLNPPDPDRLLFGLEEAKAERLATYAQDCRNLEGFLF